MHFAANVIGNLLDPYETGRVTENSEYDKLRDNMSAEGRGILIGAGVTEIDEMTCSTMNSDVWQCKPLELYVK